MYILFLITYFVTTICFPNSSPMLSWFHRLVQNEVQIFDFRLHTVLNVLVFRFSMPLNFTRDKVCCLPSILNIFSVATNRQCCFDLCTKCYIALILSLKSLDASLLHIASIYHLFSVVIYMEIVTLMRLWQIRTYINAYIIPAFVFNRLTLRQCRFWKIPTWSQHNAFTIIYFFVLFTSARRYLSVKPKKSYYTLLTAGITLQSAQIQTQIYIFYWVRECVGVQKLFLHQSNENRVDRNLEMYSIVIRWR